MAWLQECKKPFSSSYYPVHTQLLWLGWNSSRYKVKWLWWIDSVTSWSTKTIVELAFTHLGFWPLTLFPTSSTCVRITLLVKSSQISPFGGQPLKHVWQKLECSFSRLLSNAVSAQVQVVNMEAVWTCGKGKKQNAGGFPSCSANENDLQ